MDRPNQDETDVQLRSLLQHAELNGGKKNYKTFGLTTHREIIYKRIRNLQMSKSSSPIWYKCRARRFSKHRVQLALTLARAGTGGCSVSGSIVDTPCSPLKEVIPLDGPAIWGRSQQGELGDAHSTSKSGWWGLVEQIRALRGQESERTFKGVFKTTERFLKLF